MIVPITKFEVDQYINEHGGTKEFARFIICADKINEIIEHINNMKIIISTTTEPLNKSTGN